MITALLIDYGGTIDSDGIHWSELLWRFYEEEKVAVSKEAFRKAFAFAEKTLAIQPLVQPHHRFADVLRIKLNQQFTYLRQNGHLPSNDYNAQIDAITSAADSSARHSTSKAVPVLQALSNQFKLILVSNFYGNIRSVLTDYGIKHFFSEIIESAVVGVRKPDPEIFRMAINAAGVNADQCAAVGDSYRKDIAAAKAAGCYTVWLQGKGWEEEVQNPSAADKIIHCFTELENLFLKP